MTTIALFDLDETLVHGDTATEWNLFAIKKNLVNDKYYLENGRALYQDYLDGCLDIVKYMKHCLLSIKGMTPEDISPLLKEFVGDKIRPRVYPEAWKTLQFHRDKGHYLLLISASSSHIVSPVGAMLGMDACIGTDPEIIGQRYTGLITGTPSFQEGKVKRFKAWLNETGTDVEKIWFYSDSPNDIPLLEYADNPVATNPTPELEQVAKEKNWPVIRWRAPEISLD